MRIFVVYNIESIPIFHILHSKLKFIVVYYKYILIYFSKFKVMLA